MAATSSSGPGKRKTLSRTLDSKASRLHYRRIGRVTGNETAGCIAPQAICNYLVHFLSAPVGQAVAAEGMQSIHSRWRNVPLSGKAGSQVSDCTVAITKS